MFGRRAAKVMQRGDRTSGRIVAIRVEKVSGDSGPADRRSYVVETGGRRHALHQALLPADRVRLGMTVHVWVRGDDAVIDWATTMSGLGTIGDNDTSNWKSVKDWGANGIIDEVGGFVKARTKGLAATLRIERIERSSRLGGLMHTISFVSTVMPTDDEPYEVTLPRVMVPFYALHLPAVGVVLPAFIDARRLDRVTIDWPAAAERSPGVGEAPSVEIAPLDDVTDPVMEVGSLSTDGNWVVPSPSDDFRPPEPIEGVSWSMFLEVTAGIQRNRIKPKQWDEYAQSFGVPAGAWVKASQQWGMKMVRNAQLQQSYTSAMQ